MSVSAPPSFTARDLSRSPAKVFKAVRSYGSADIRTRDGDVFVVTLREKEVPAKTSEEIWADFDRHYAHLRELGHVPAPESERDRIDKIIAGEI